MRKIALLILLLAFTRPALAQQPKQGIDSLQWYKRKCDTLSHKAYIDAFKYQQLKRYVQIVIKRPKSATYLNSWLRNCDAVKY